jgi:hypothetical protein
VLAKFVLISLLLQATTVLAAASEASHSQGWLRIYQYKHKIFGGYRSAISADRFFFSPKGMTDPDAEMTAAIAAFESVNGKYGTQGLPASCVFPARKRVLEKLIGRQFPSPKCTDLDEWISRLHADRASVVFVGAYAGNPASILGHTFLRLFNQERESSGREGLDLLSYAVGFTAQADPKDTRALYMVKGLTGGYPGFYEIDPHYMKVGLYNNSESRDLWDLTLDFSKSEVELLVMHLWELTFNAKFDYFFLDENCSYRLITILEAIRPSLDVSRKLSTIVLPAETVRALEEAKIIEASPRFRASIRRRLSLKIAALTIQEKTQFAQAKSSTMTAAKLENANVIDALLDHWLYENYRAHANLPAQKREIMEATYLRSSQLTETSKFHLSDKDIRDRYDLMPPFAGHKPKWLEAKGGLAKEGATAGLSFRSGVHPYWSGDRGYEDVSAIEYLGGDIDWREKQNSLWSLLFVKARSSEGSSDQLLSVAWNFEAKTTNDCLLCQTTEPIAEISGGAGAAIRLENFHAFFIGDLRSAAWSKDGTQGLLAPGILLGAKLYAGRWTIIAESQHHYFNHRVASELQARLTHQTTSNFNLFVSTGYREVHDGMNEATTTLGLVQFFD